MMTLQMTPEERRAKRTAANKAWRDANPGRAEAASIKWHRAHLQESKASKKAWRKANLDIVHATRNKYAKISLKAKASAKRAELKDRARSPNRSAEYARACRDKEASRPRPKVCEACGLPSKRTLHFDHCHATNKFRGWLCNNCNMALGLLHDNTASLAGLLRYLKVSRDDV